MCMKMCIHYSLLRRLASYKVCLCFIVLSVTFCIVGYVCSFRGDQIFVDFVSFLSMIIYEILYTWCLRYNICSTWFLDIRISTCFSVWYVVLCITPGYCKSWYHYLPCWTFVWLCKVTNNLIHFSGIFSLLLASVLTTPIL